MSSVSVVIKAKNEEIQIAQVIESAKMIATEIIVIDDSSNDRTAEIAQTMGARVLQGAPHGGLIDRLDIQGFESATSEWILRMDADERLTPELATALRGVMTSTFDGACYCRQYVMFGAGVRHGGWGEPQQLGFFRSLAWDRAWTAELHSQVPIRGQIVSLPWSSGQMIHLDYEDIREFCIRSFVGYAFTEAQRLAAQDYEVRFRDLTYKPIRKILGRLLLRQGYRDGYRGVILSILLGVYEFMIYAMAWNLREMPALNVSPRAQVGDGMNPR